MNRLRQRLPGLVLLFAGVLATGALLDLAQLAVWGQMFATNLQTREVGNALAQTFSEAGRCGMCKAIEMIKQEREDQHPVGIRVAEKCPPLLPICFAKHYVTRPSASGEVLCIEGNNMGREIGGPPLPPPRWA